MVKKEFPYEYTCPYCKKGKPLADNVEETNISCKCSEYGNVYVRNMQTQRGTETLARSSPNAPRKPTKY